MKLKFIFFALILVINMECKENEVSVNEDTDPFYMEIKEGCPSTSEKYLNMKDETCLTKKELLLCYNMFQKVQASQIEQIFPNTKWSISEQDSKHILVDKQGRVTILEGGPSKMEDDYQIIGKGRFFREKGTLMYKHSCQTGMCENLTFPIEYISCDSMFHASDERYHLSITIGNRYYDFLEENKDSKHLSIEFNGTVKPQIRNGFEFYLVPPPK
ncbi:hypothetical protein EHQ23_11710 [Leptospira bourretii]|uniref:Uncharacterized protein n=1 Tax=Leptospira bourretii TaxID=2484962 RepID=A0A4V3JLB4_9LEPT|nr:hypothetical protein [Leptospira bourretii]TGK85319.1 hypothetical protein EHQ23_11710 [Leptospira bourretii]TGK91079.1 hypothetical protein EHQ26_13315 [Leptospira bourretii]TGL33314.1 hypothetical protein EHQ45_10210 [Leptospira bourretii]